MKQIFIVITILLLSFETFSQADSVIIDNNDFYNEYYSNLTRSIKENDYNAAYVHWKKLYKKYPKYKALYSKGDYLIRMKIKETHNKAVEILKFANKAKEENRAEEANKLMEQQKHLLEEKELWVDTLLMIYDQRIKYLGDDKNYGMGYLKGKKGSYIYQYRKDSSLNEAYDLLKESIDMQKENSSYIVVKDYFEASMDMIKAEKIGPDQMVNDYNTSVDILKKSTEKFSSYVEKEKKKSAPKGDKIKNWEKMISNNTKVSEYITKYFASSEPANCELLIIIFEKEFETKKDNIVWISNVVEILFSMGCVDNLFYEELIKIIGSEESNIKDYFGYGDRYLSEEEFIKAAEEFKGAYTLEKDSVKKSEYYYYAAVTAFAMNDFLDSRELALKAVDFNQNYCKPYILIAKLYAASASSCFTDSFEKRAVYWAAVDKLEKAKTVDASCSEEVIVLIEKYSTIFPGTSGFDVIREGNKYFVACWIQETTIVRFKE